MTTSNSRDTSASSVHRWGLGTGDWGLGTGDWGLGKEKLMFVGGVFPLLADLKRQRQKFIIFAGVRR
ncbi:MAG: hypothetical protein HEQ35_08380 [Gloeotrichia echinulata IR180]|nr:hypothetical protein [Gloeotrichia echinulata DEX184]